ncbi:MAG: dipeptidase [Pseudomonadota bacterium]
MKKLAIALGVVATLAVLFFALAPGLVERQLNAVTAIDLAEPSTQAAALHASATVIDLHGDTLLWRRSILEASDRGHIDLPRLQQGNVALQVLASVTQSPKGLNYDSNADNTDSLVALAIAQRQPVRTWRSLFERSMWHAQRLNEAAERSDDLMTVRNVRDLEALLSARAAGEPRVGGLLAVEGLHNLEGDADNLQRLFDVGYRMAGLTHFFDNALAGSMHGIDKGGLTPFGRDIVARMESLGMIVDLAHLSSEAVDEVLDMATRPVVVSHGGVKALCPNNRNLTDEQVRRIAATGGVIGIGYWPGAVCGLEPARIAAAMRHVRDLVGVDHVALGSDYDGTVEVAFDTSRVAVVTQALIDAGFTEGEIRQVLGGNALRLFRETLPR